MNNSYYGLGLTGVFPLIFALRPVIHYPKRTDKPLFNGLVKQCQTMGIRFVEETPTKEELDSDYDLIVDALFGFSFRPPVRPQVAPLLRALAETSTPLASIDVPSGWDVENGAPDEQEHGRSLRHACASGSGLTEMGAGGIFPSG